MIAFFHFQGGATYFSTLIDSSDFLAHFLKGNLVRINDKIYVIRDVVSTEILINYGGIGVETRLISLI